MIEFCDRYFQAFRERDAQAILTMVAADYQDDSGTPRFADDDVDEALLRETLPKLLDSISALEVVTTYLNITEHAGIISVRVHRKGAFEMNGRRIPMDEENLLRLRSLGDDFEFVSGL